MRIVYVLLVFIALIVASDVAKFLWNIVSKAEEAIPTRSESVQNAPAKLSREHVIPAEFDWSDQAAKKELLEKFKPLLSKEGTVLIDEGESLVTSGVMTENGAFVFHTFTPKRVTDGIEVTMGQSEIDLSGTETEHEDRVVTLTSDQIQIFSIAREKEMLSVSMHAEEDEQSGKIALQVTEGFRNEKAPIALPNND